MSRASRESVGRVSGEAIATVPQAESKSYNTRRPCPITAATRRNETGVPQMIRTKGFTMNAKFNTVDPLPSKGAL